MHTHGEAELKIILDFLALSKFGVVIYKDDRIKPRGTPIAIHNSGGKNAEYLSLSLRGKSYREHRVVWALTYRKWPAGQIHHIDSDTHNNAIANLQDVTNGQNQSCSAVAWGYSKFKGVRWHRRTKKWRMNISREGFEKIEVSFSCADCGPECISCQEEAARCFDKYSIAMGGIALNFSK